MPSIDEFLMQVRQARPVEPIPLDEPVPLEALHTPALVIDLDVYEDNLRRMQAYADDKGLALRPHTKMHKCPVIARQQVAGGATGVCAAKVSEAEVMCAAGIEDVLITSPIATPEKVARFVQLAASYQGVKIVVDNPAAMQLLNQQAGAAGICVDVIVDIDPGMGRTGVEAGRPVVDLVLAVQACASLRFSGLQMYAGNCMHIEGFQKRRHRYEQVMAKGEQTLNLLEQAGIEVPVFTGGGTGTYNIEQGLGLISELQAGSYIFMDIEYRDIGGENSELFSDFPVALYVLVTAISQPQSRLITVDAGFKSFASDKMPPQFRDVEGVTYHWGGDEHGIIQLDNPSRMISPGDKLPMLTPHCDPTVNLHDFYFPYRNGVVSEIWPVTARGFSQ